MLAAAEKDLCRLFCHVLDRRKFGVRMRAIAEGLLLAFSARAPKVTFARFNID